MAVQRELEHVLKRHLARGKSILLLGPRQTGKTTLLQQIQANLRIELLEPRERQRFEQDPSLLRDQVFGLGSKRPLGGVAQFRTEADAIRSEDHEKPRRRRIGDTPTTSDEAGRSEDKSADGRNKGPPLVIIDEVQRVPELMDVAQGLIDQGSAQFILTGSSARKLKRNRNINLLPGRVVSLRLDPFTLAEQMSELSQALTDGALPGIRNQTTPEAREQDLRSYVETYLEEEVRQEALVKHMAPFGRFLELAALESGKITNFSALASDVGVSPPTIQGYYEILVDCLVAERVDPITRSTSRKKLTKSSRYLIFDMGVRRLAAREGREVGRARVGELFEQWVGLQLTWLCRLHAPGAKLRFWRDPDGPEVDWVIEHEGSMVPIEVKWSERPTLADARHLQVFLNEYPQARSAWILCRCARPLAIAPKITALPWQSLGNPTQILRRMLHQRTAHPSPRSSPSPSPSLRPRVPKRK